MSNALTIPAGAVAVLDNRGLTAADVYGTKGGAEDLIARVEREARATPRDISTEKGRKAIAALVELGISDEKAKATLVAIVRGTIPHVTMNY